MEQVHKKVREKGWRYLLTLIFGVSLFVTSSTSADCVKPVYSGENLWKLVARIGECFEDSFEHINSQIDTITCNSSACEFTISQADIPYVITQPGIYCLAESVSNTGVNDFLITVSSSDVILDLTQHVMYGGNQDGYEQGAQDGIQVWPGMRNVTIKNGTLTGFAQYAINASTALQPDIQVPIDCLTIEDIQVLDLSAYLPGQSNIDFYADKIGSTLDALSASAVAGFDPVLECCLGNEFTRIKTPAGIFVDGANNVIINGCSVLNAEGDGIYLRYVQDGVIQNTESDGNGGNGFVFDNCDVMCVKSCGAEQNGLNGFYEVACNGDNSYTDSNAKQNGVHGFRVIGSGKTIERCVANQNTLHGFFVVTAENSTVDGSLDITFDGDGKVITDLGGSDVARATVVQKDGKIVAVGDSDATDFVLVRYNTDGSLDTNFGVNGVVTTVLTGSTNLASALGIQDDGKLVVVGSTNGGGTYDFILQRYSTNGSLELSIVTDFNSSLDSARAVAIQEDGKMIAAGYSNAGGSNNFALARYNIDGSLDTSFNGTGKVVTDFGSDDQINAIVLQTDGKIVAAGTTSVGGFYDFALARYNTDGSLDTSFNGTGKVITDFGGTLDQAFAVALQKDGKIVAIGTTNAEESNDFALARYNIDGSLDTSFGIMGKVITDFSSGTNDQGRAVVIQKDGRIILSGSTNVGGPNSFAIVRYHTDGSLDTSFNGTGLVLTDFGGVDLALAAALQEDGKLVAVGLTLISGNTDFALARYNVFKRPTVIQDSIALENGQDGFNIVEAAQVTLLRNVASNNGCNGFIAPALFASALDIVAKNMADNNQCANFSNIDSVLLDVAVLPWANVAGN